MTQFRIAEIFGPTIQGEGALIGTQCHFIRFGGCDYRCGPCDSPHAVLPHLVARLPKMDEVEIMSEVNSLPRFAPWVVLSGGNPALFSLGELIRMLHVDGYLVMAETQGTEYKSWLADLDNITISPKGPGMAGLTGKVTPPHVTKQFLTDLYVDMAERWEVISLKVVVFNRADFEYARRLHRDTQEIPMYLSVGNDVPSLPTVQNAGQGDPDAPIDKGWLLKRLRTISEWLLEDPLMDDVRVLPQMHVLTWGNERGR